MKHLSFLLILASSGLIGLSQPNDTNDSSLKLILNFQLAEYPFLKTAVQSRYNYRTSRLYHQPTDVGLRDYIALIESPSMQQVNAYTSSFYNSMNYGVAKLWKLDQQHKGKTRRIWNIIGAEFTSAFAFALTTKLPFAGGWAHEEYHRTTWSQHKIGSCNHIWGFDLAPDALTYVGCVHDHDLGYFKAKDPAGYVRMGSSGIEAHYQISETIQRQSFMQETGLPNLALFWANFIAAQDYVNRAHTTKTIDEHAELYDDETDELKRDFIGNDFTAWVYDLFKAEELYTDRGIHPTGVGIDRYRDYNDLSDEMRSYVKKMADRQWLNVISPFMFRVNKIKVNDDLSFNFALRHYLTSFGDNMKLDLFIHHKKQKSIIALHKYSNFKEEWHPGLEYTHFFDQIIGKKITGSLRAMGWIQPKNQNFYTTDGQLGNLVSLNLAYKSKGSFSPYIELESKSKGWVAGNPYLGHKNSLRFGFQLTY